MASSRYEGGVETFRLAINLRVVVSSGDVIHPKSDTVFHQDIQQKLKADTGGDLWHNTVICHPVLKESELLWRRFLVGDIALKF